jgi:hypothetical protein
VKLYFRCCEKEPTISYVQRYKDYSKKTIIRYSWASLVDQLTDRDHVIIIHDEVSAETLKWMDKRITSGLVTYVEVPKHDFSYHQHTVTLVDELEKQIQNNQELHFLIEDDYLFKTNTLETVRSMEGLYDGFFVPYDYPDRYQHSKPCQVVLGQTCHWRTIDSCTMTIGANAKLWREVIPQLREAAPTSNDKVFEGLFTKYPCLSPIPGLATHLTAHHHTPYFPVEKRLSELEITNA